MNNRDYYNKNKELQLYNGSLDNYEESGNTLNNNRTDSNNNYLPSLNVTNNDELGNTSEDDYAKPHYNQKYYKTHIEHKEKDYMPHFLIGAFLFFIFGLSIGIYSLPKLFSSKAPSPPPQTRPRHPFMTLDQLSMPMFDGEFESNLETANLPAVNHAISVGRARLKFLSGKSSGWEEKKDEASKKLDLKGYTTYKTGSDFNQYRIEKLEKQLKMLEEKKKELVASKK